MIKLIICVLILLVLLFLSQGGRKNHPGLEYLKGFSYAHRGLHGNGVPENSMKAFALAKEKGYGIELDIHLLKDGTLAIMHDSALKRTTGSDGVIEDLTSEDLTSYHLEGTEETIPLFKDVLELYDGAAPIVVELKPYGNNYNALSAKAAEMLDKYKGKFCVESFDPRCILWIKKHRPDYVRGQLSENFFKGPTNLPGILKFILTYTLENFLTRPDFVAYNFDHRKKLTVAIWKKLWKLQPVSWTIKSEEDYKTAVEEGWIPIFEGFEPEK